MQCLHSVCNTIPNVMQIFENTQLPKVKVSALLQKQPGYNACYEKSREEGFIGSKGAAESLHCTIKTLHRGHSL